jgi:hypothetical protein
MTRTSRYEPPELPEDGVLTLSEYLAVQRAVGNETRYRALAELLREGEMAASELAEEREPLARYA